MSLSQSVRSKLLMVSEILSQHVIIRSGIVDDTGSLRIESKWRIKSKKKGKKGSPQKSDSKGKENGKEPMKRKEKIKEITNERDKSKTADKETTFPLSPFPVLPVSLFRPRHMIFRRNGFQLESNGIRKEVHSASIHYYFILKQNVCVQY